MYDAIYPEEYIDWTHFYDTMLTLNGGIDVLVYAGTYDQQDGPLTMYEWMHDLKTLQINNNAFWTQARKVYYIPDGADNSTVGGYYRSDSRFTFLAVPKAGHFVPTTNMPATRAFLRDYLSSARALGCYNATREANKCSSADIMCSYLRNETSGQDCSGHGSCDSVVTGKCSCETGYRGSDCSKQVTVLQDKFNAIINFNGTRIFYMQYEAGVFSGDDWELSLTNLNAFNVYLSAGLAVDPTESTNDIEVKGQTYVKISSRAFPSLKSSFVI